MAFRDLIAYLVIKIWIKSKLPKIVLQEKIGLVKNENPKGSIATKKSLKGEAQNSVQTTKRNWTYMQSRNNMFFSIASIDHISLISTPNCNPFEALDS